LLQSIRAMRAKELGDVLNPDTAAVAKVVELSSGFEDQLVAARQDLRQKRSAIDILLAQPKPDDPALNRAVDALMAQRRKLEDIEAERTAALRKVLTPNQFARVVVAWPRINRRIQEQLYRALLSAKQGAVDVE
jgi:Spy/CpxP family protein refolding chaperone